MDICKQNIRKYYLELGLSFVFYAVALILAMHFGYRMHRGLLRTLILVAPMIPCLFATWAIVRQFRRMDEYQRLKATEDVVISAAVTALVTVTYGFFENAGFPRLTMFVVWPIMGGTWFVCSMCRLIAGYIRGKDSE